MIGVPELGAEFGVAPTADPLTYPGVPPAGSTLLLGAAALRLHERSRRRLPQWRVALGDHVVPGEERSADVLPLNYLLLRHNQTPMAGRVPVVAVGSNASPAQMYGKFTRAGVSPVLPMVLAAEVRGIGIGVSAHVSKPGYLPTTAVVGDELRSRLFVIWPDRAQLAALDATEPNYHRVLLPDPQASVILPSGENLSHCYAYVSRHGNLTDADGRPLTIPDAVGLRSATGTQEALIRSVFDRDPELAALLDDGVRALCARFAREPALRESVRLLYRDRGWVRDCPRLAALVAGAGGDERSVGRAEVITYDDRAPAHRVPPGSFRVRPSSDGFDRRGEAVVRVSPATARGLSAAHALVSLVPIGDVSGPGIRALARVVACDEVRGDHVAEVDQIVRNAIGSEVGEDVLLAPVEVGARRGDRLFGRPNYVTCRVQAADLTTVEREVCLLDDLTLSLLGIQSGDEVVVEGWAADGETVREVRIKAFQASEAVVERRETLHGGDLSCRFPRSLDALAVSPDLPWIFLDSATRTELGLGAQKLSTVRLRASRRFQLRKELREMLFLLGIAFFGLISVLKDAVAQVVSLAALLVFVGAVVTVRMRGRLVQELRKPRRRRS